MHGEGGAGAGRAVDGQPAAVAIEEVLDQRQAEPGSALGAALGDVDAIEPFRQPRQMFRRDAGPVIAHAGFFFSFSARPAVGGRAPVAGASGAGLMWTRLPGAPYLSAFSTRFSKRRTSSSRSPRIKSALPASTLTPTPRSRASVSRPSTSWRTIGTRSTGLSGRPWAL